MIHLFRVHIYSIETITTDTRIQEMNPSITGVAEGSYPLPEQISYYIYKFANRYASKGEVDHLNSSIRGRDHETERVLEKMIGELEEESDDEESTDSDLIKAKADEDTNEKAAATVMASTTEKTKNTNPKKKRKATKTTKAKKKKKKKRASQGQRTMYQRGLGLFIRIEISNEGITCNDENFMRWGECFFTRFFKFLCLGEAGWPDNPSEMNYVKANVGFEELQINLKKAMATFVSDRPTLDKKWCCPPAQDPMMVIPRFENGERNDGMTTINHSVMNSHDNGQGPYSITTQLSQDA